MIKSPGDAESRDGNDTSKGTVKVGVGLRALQIQTPTNSLNDSAAPEASAEPEADISFATSSESGNSKVRWLVFGLVAMVGAGVAAVSFNKRSEGVIGIPVNVVVVKSVALPQTIEGSGQVVSKKRVEVTSPLPGKIASILVKKNESVRRGQVMASLDDRAEKARLQQAEAKVKNAQTDVATSQQALESIMAKVTSGVLPTQALNDAGVAVESSRAYLQLAREELQAASFALERHTITSPFDGVVYAIHVREGATAGASSTLFTVVDPRALEVEIQVNDTERAELFPGQTALLKSTEFPGKEWTTDVARIVPIKKGGKNSDEVSVLLNLGEGAPPVEIGHPIQAQIHAPAQAAVLQVPADAIAKSESGHDTAAVVSNGTVHFVSVVTGEVTPTTIEIRQGLVEGQTVLPLAKMSSWPTEGAHVKVIEASEEL